MCGTMNDTGDIETGSWPNSFEDHLKLGEKITLNANDNNA